MDEPSADAASGDTTTSPSGAPLSINVNAVHIFVKLAMGNWRFSLDPFKRRPVSASITAQELPPAASLGNAVNKTDRNSTMAITCLNHRFLLLPLFQMLLGILS